ncbi:LuxR C-terminal-related transcriptional regulator [Umezawaea sp. Da 62-37]|uniref:LuxR C-terminal-related transcriptional regulator n=1 Tax=Umezawaea sp. Da 62-37 TaxID=3075927 RepID=UPI0028F6FB1F|nr:LuxR C-terminal-related transcriptional regulator [Umezawaea sp. Da 62-37]WNV87314.1 LuxR C-terminal-related transcriptional regulator [Umezawaea sp. Da 62-37]
MTPPHGRASRDDVQRSGADVLPGVFAPSYLLPVPGRRPVRRTPVGDLVAETLGIDGQRPGSAVLPVVRDGRDPVPDAVFGTPGPPRAHGPGCAAALAVDALGRGVDRAAAVRYARAALADPDCGADPGCAWHAMVTLIEADDLPAADAGCERLATLPLGEVGEQVRALVRGRISFLSGDAAGAREVLETRLADGVDPALEPAATAWLTEALAELGDVRAAGELLVRRGYEDALPGGEAGRALLLAARGRLRMAEGGVLRGVKDHLLCGRELANAGFTNGAVLAWRSRAALGALALRSQDLAVELARAELESARTWEAPRALGWALYVVALAEHGDRGVALVTESVDLLDFARARSELVRALYDLAQLLNSRGDLSRARRALKRATAVAEECGNAYWAGHCANALRTLADGTPEEVLTNQEARVAELARAGYRNDEIAGKMGLTRRTVEFHLSSIYRKLGIAGRRDLHTAMTSRS